MNKNLITQSEEVKKEATLVLDQSQLLQILSDYGEVKIFGSFDLDLMMRPDIDILVFRADYDYDKAIDIAREILRKKYFHQLCFVDKVENNPGIPKGYYLQPHKKIGERNWKIDVWLTTKNDFDDRHEEFKSKLNDAPNREELRSKILALKVHFKEDIKYKGNIDGQKIYRAVLDNMNASLEELIELLMGQI